MTARTDVAFPAKMAELRRTLTTLANIALRPPLLGYPDSLTMGELKLTIVFYRRAPGVERPHGAEDWGGSIASAVFQDEVGKPSLDADAFAMDGSVDGASGRIRIPFAAIIAIIWSKHGGERERA